MPPSIERVLIICHPELVPPLDQLEAMNAFSDYVTEHDVYRALDSLGVEVEFIGLDSLESLSDAIDDFRPELCFNLAEEFDGDPTKDMNVVSYLEMIGMPYTGCNPKGLMIARDKSLSKKVMEFHQIPTPEHFVVPIGSVSPEEGIPKFPLFVKSLVEEASLGISQASMVRSQRSLDKRVLFIHEKIHTDAIVDQFIPGRELYLAMMGNSHITSFPLWELDFGDLNLPQQKIASRNTKWNESYRDKNKIDVNPASNLSPRLAKKIQQTCEKAYQAMELSGYARFDIRLRDDDEFFIIEANPNPNISEQDEFALAAKSTGIDYPQLILSLCELGISKKKK